MKKIFILFLCISLFAGVTAGCGELNFNKGKLSIVTTIFPEYDWVMQILGDTAAQADVAMLLDNGVDLHSYRPTADDIVRISSCDMFIYVGGESDKWVADVLNSAVNKDMVVINLLEVLGDDAKAEETVEGMQADEHDHDGDEHDHDGDEHDHGEETEFDEHVWLSLKNAAKLCKYIAARLGEIDPDNKAAYIANANAYIDRLNALDAAYADAVNAAGTKSLVFGDRFPFRYLADDYGLDYFAAFSGCSAESEASFDTIMFLARKVDEPGLDSIMQIESSDEKIADTIRQATKTKDQQILTLDSMQSTTAADVKKGASYLSIMEKNLEVLKKALN